MGPLCWCCREGRDVTGETGRKTRREGDRQGGGDEERGKEKGRRRERGDDCIKGKQKNNHDSCNSYYGFYTSQRLLWLSTQYAAINDEPPRKGNYPLSRRNLHAFYLFISLFKFLCILHTVDRLPNRHLKSVMQTEENIEDHVSKKKEEAKKALGRQAISQVFLLNVSDNDALSLWMSWKPSLTSTPLTLSPVWASYMKN